MLTSRAPFSITTSKLPSGKGSCSMSATCRRAGWHLIRSWRRPRARTPGHQAPKRRVTPRRRRCMHGGFLTCTPTHPVLHARGAGGGPALHAPHHDARQVGARHVLAAVARQRGPQPAVAAPQLQDPVRWPQLGRHQVPELAVVLRSRAMHQVCVRVSKEQAHSLPMSEGAGSASSITFSAALRTLHHSYVSSSANLASQ
jgi:hypothetical protein